MIAASCGMGAAFAETGPTPLDNLARSLSVVSRNLERLAPLPFVREIVAELEEFQGGLDEEVYRYWCILAGNSVSDRPTRFGEIVREGAAKFPLIDLCLPELMGRLRQDAEDRDSVTAEIIAGRLSVIRR